MRRIESREACARKLARRKWEARASVSLSLRHGQNEFHRSVQRDVQKALERRFRGRKLPKGVKQQIRHGVHR